MFTAIIILSVLAQSLVALFVLQKNRKSLTNISFFLLSVFVATWATINFIITKNPFSSTQLEFYRLLMASVVVQNTFFFIFSHVYPGDRLQIRKRLLVYYFILSSAVFIVALSPLLFTKVMYGQSGARPVGGPGMLAFIFHAGISVFFGLSSIYRKYKKAHGVKRQQFRMILFGSIILWGIVPITNFVISMATQTLFFARISPLYTLAFSSIIAYAIVAQKLFDIRAAVARSVAYLLSLGSLGLVYGGIIYSVATLLSGTQWYTQHQRIFYIGLALLTSLIYQRLVNFFNRITNRIFYQDAYDPQLLISNLNNIVVGNIDLQPLLKGCAQLIKDTLKVDFCTFLILPTADRTYRTIGTTVHDKFKHDITPEIADHLGESKTRLFVADDAHDIRPAIAKFLLSEDIAVLSRLSPGGGEVGLLGYMVLGAKKSGNPYNKQDLAILETVSSELVIAAQNAMRFEEIQGFNVTLQAKVNQATRELQHANEKLVTLNDTKDDFISMASHQLRTPLTAVKGNISMVLDGDFGKVPKPLDEPLGQAFTSSERMVGLIADLLNVSRLRTGKFAIQPVISNLDTIVQSELKQLQESARAHHLKLTYDRPKDFPTLMLDEIKIRQVIMNFVDNAIYYTPAGGHIKVALKHSSKAIEFTVEDDGIGVPHQLQHHLFTKFYRASNAQKMRPDGTGIGLFMAKKVIIASGGSLIFKSTEGKGSTFGFVFPITKLKPSGHGGEVLT